MSSKGTDIELARKRLSNETLSPYKKCNNVDTGGPRAPKEDAKNKQSVNSPVQVQNNQWMYFYSPDIEKHISKPWYATLPLLPTIAPWLPIDAFPAFPPIVYQIMSTPQKYYGKL